MQTVAPQSAKRLPRGWRADIRLADNGGFSVDFQRGDDAGVLVFNTPAELFDFLAGEFGLPPANAAAGLGAAAPASPAAPDSPPFEIRSAGDAETIAPAAELEPPRYTSPLRANPAARQERLRLPSQWEVKPAVRQLQPAAPAELVPPAKLEAVYRALVGIARRLQQTKFEVQLKRLADKAGVQRGLLPTIIAQLEADGRLEHRDPLKKGWGHIFALPAQTLEGEL
jgi:hypothetical protein